MNKSSTSQHVSQLSVDESLSMEDFALVGKSVEKMESVSRPSLSYWQDAWRRLKRNRIAFVGLIIIIVYILFAIFAPIFSPYKFDTQNVKSRSMSFSAAHWFGTDNLGRDLFTRTWMGARVSLTIGLVATLINTLFGCILGGLSGYFGGRFDTILMRIVEVLYGIPSMIVTMLIMAVLGPGIQSLIIAMCLVGWIGTCRFIRGEVLRLKNDDYVSAAKVLGTSDGNIIFRHIMPNMLGLIITNLTLAIPGAIFREAFLSYIGIGIAPPEASWGVLAKEGVKFLRSFPHQLFVPAFFISTTMLALNLLGDGLRDVFDPKLRGTD